MVSPARLRSSGQLGGPDGVETKTAIAIACISANIIRLGDVVLWIKARPIGRFMSKIATSSVLIFSETLWLQHPALWANAGFLTSHPPRGVPRLWRPGTSTLFS